MAESESVNMPEDELAATEHENEQVEPGTEQDNSLEAPAAAAADPADQPAEPAAAEPPAAERNSRASAGHENSSIAQPAAHSSTATVASKAQQQDPATPAPAAVAEAPAEVTPPAQPAEPEPEQQQETGLEHHAAHKEEEHTAAVQHHEQVHHSSIQEAHEGHQQIKFSPRQQQHRGPNSTVGASHRSIGPGTIYRSTDGRLLTFTKPPYTYKAKPYRRVDYSHSKNCLMKIAHDNQLLVSHLTVISKQVHSWTKDASAPPAPGNTASAAVNRRKKATVIAQENHALYQRLVAIRPSKDISRDTLEAGYRQNEVYRVNCAQFKPTGKAATAGTAAH